MLLLLQLPPSLLHATDLINRLLLPLPLLPQDCGLCRMFLPLFNICSTFAALRERHCCCGFLFSAATWMESRNQVEYCCTKVDRIKGTKKWYDWDKYSKWKTKELVHPWFMRRQLLSDKAKAKARGREREMFVSKCKEINEILQKRAIK